MINPTTTTTTVMTTASTNPMTPPPPPPPPCHHCCHHPEAIVEVIMLQFLPIINHAQNLCLCFIQDNVLNTRCLEFFQNSSISFLARFVSLLGLKLIRHFGGIVDNFGVISRFIHLFSVNSVQAPSNIHFGSVDHVVH